MKVLAAEMQPEAVDEWLGLPNYVTVFWLTMEPNHVLTLPNEASLQLDPYMIHTSKSVPFY